jgi:hypothetical protein
MTTNPSRKISFNDDVLAIKSINESLLKSDTNKNNISGNKATNEKSKIKDK